MKNNRVIKFVLLILTLMSLSILIASIPTTLGLANQSQGVVTSYMHDDKKLIEDDFFRSKAFDEGTLRPLVYQLSMVIQDTTTLEGDTKKEIENKIKSSKEQLGYYNNIEYFSINDETGEYYTNTRFKSKSEFKSKDRGYYKVEIKSVGYNLDYTKKIGNKVFEKANVNVRIGDLMQVEDCEIYISIPQKLVVGDNIYWNNYQFVRDTKLFKAIAILDIVTFVVFIASLILYKKVKVNLLGKESKFINLYNKIPLEIIIVLLIPILFIYLRSLTLYWFEFELSIVNTVATFALIFMVYITIKQIQNNDKIWSILSNSITVRVFKLFKDSVCKVSNASKKISLIKRLISLMLICILVYIVGVSSLTYHYMNYWGMYVSPIKFIIIAIAFTLPILVFGCYILKKLAYLSEIMEGTKRIKDGDLGYKIKIEGNDNFTTLAEDINNIGEGLDNSIDKQLRSERMKSELITNVSHDLKTPLTSIINYIELIKKEEYIEPEYLKDYVNVLDSKSKRLKVLIEDLFEASKASSGNIELNMEKIDLNQLLRQSIGEVEEKILASKLDIRLSMPEDKVFISADGKRLYRVLENILSNIVKYSLENTRVYIDLIIDDGKVRLTTKNISSYELNFEPEEIMERFKRGDEARNTEGSGLGLAIARDLVRIQGGEFNIEIDGDLFKSIIEFNIE